MENEPELAEPSTKHILVVDDDAAIVDMLGTALRGQGFQVATAGDGEEAIAKFREKTPDLILTDLMMPGTGGFDLIRQLKQDEDSRVPVIVFTARYLDESTEHLIKTEPNVIGHEKKPLKMAVLFARLHQVLKTKAKPHVARGNSW